MMKVLVTGGAGFVGTNLIKRLLQERHEVVSVDNYTTGLKENHQQGCEYLEYDIRNIHSYDFIKPDFVYHLAATARIQPSFKNPKDYFTTNVNGTLNIAHWCKENDVPIVYAGSSSKHSGKFMNPYTFSKDIGEEILDLYSRNFGLKYVITRFYNVYGPHQLTEGGYTTLIGRWLNNIAKGIQCEIYGDGEQRRDFTHVDDIVDALYAILNRECWNYQFELGKGRNYSVNEVAQMMNITPVYKEAKPGEARETLNQDQTASLVLDWQPYRNLEDYLKQELK